MNLIYLQIIDSGSVVGLLSLLRQKEMSRICLDPCFDALENIQSFNCHILSQQTNLAY